MKALRLFAQTTYFKSLMKAGDATPSRVAGLTKEECDAQVGELLTVLG